MECGLSRTGAAGIRLNRGPPVACRRVNRVRRLLSYRSMRDRKRYVEHCHQHLEVLQLLERERNEEASQALREHLGSTLRNLGRISDILQPGAASDAPSSIPV